MAGWGLKRVLTLSHFSARLSGAMRFIAPATARAAELMVAEGKPREARDRVLAIRDFTYSAAPPIRCKSVTLLITCVPFSVLMLAHGARAFRTNSRFFLPFTLFSSSANGQSSNPSARQLREMSIKDRVEVCLLKGVYAG